jgi:hypothetical protein
MGLVKSPCLKALTDSTLLTTPLFKKEVIKNFGHSNAFRSSHDEHGKLKFFEFCKNLPPGSFPQPNLLIWVLAI